MLKLQVDYPTRDEEREIAKRYGSEKEIELNSILTTAQIDEIAGLISEIMLDEKLLNYILDIVFATREPEKFGLESIASQIEYGASPRATIFLSNAAKAFAFLQGRAFVTPQDIKSVAPDVLRHRIILSYEAEAEDITSDDVIRTLFDTIEVP